MGKRERAKLEREQRARMEARSAVYAELWKQPGYVRLSDRMHAANRDISYYKYQCTVDPGALTRAEARFKRLHRRLQRIENAALAAAGFTP